MRKVTIFFLFFILFSCGKQTPHPYTFYYWKTNLALNQSEKAALEIATTPYLYTRFFDVDKIGGKFQPVATVAKDNSFRTDKAIVPVVFIMNRTFLNIKPEEINFLAQKIFALIEKKTTEFSFKKSNEIQIDCDWTAGTREDYFNFLKALKQISGKEITSTLRLHQVKDKELMGIPPVSKVYLMCYSTSSPLENSDKNSILEVQVLKNYLHDLDQYPIKNIAVALPIYSWGIVSNHLGKRKLINALSAKDLADPRFRKLSETAAEITEDGFYFGQYLNKGFKIKIEQISEEQITEVTRFIDKKLTGYPIIYYQLDGKFLKNRNFHK